MRRLAALLILLGWPACAYYHFVRYNTSTPPYRPVYDKFDLNVLPGKAVPFLITMNGPLTLAPGDSETAVISQIRAAAAVWSSVPTSELRLVFGGFREDSSPLSTPYIQVEFTDELPPGVIAQGGPIARLDPAEGPEGAFTPIARSLLRLPKDLSSRPSWSERFFLTVVHEFGHTLGLQHSWASGVMSTEITRATTKAQPLAEDDIAGLSILYPTAEFRRSTGAITGRVTMNGEGVPLASVVAIVSGRTAVSALTAPDGTYRIEGLPPGSYFLYAHPLPPSIAGEPQPVNLDLPTTPTGRVLPGPPFRTVFYPGSSAPVSSLHVKATETVEGVDFRVSPISSVNLHSIQTYSFYNRNAIKPATLQMASSWRSVVFTGYGASALSPGLSVAFLNAPETILPGTLKQYSPGYLQVDVNISPFSGDGPRHLIFELNGETYILPSGVAIRKKDPPAITSITPQQGGWLAIEGTNLDASTSVWVDGVPAQVKFEEGRLRILPPPAPSGHTGVLVAFNTDGQSSLYTHGNSSPVVSYADAASPVVETGSIQIPAGAEMAVEIRGEGFDFRQWRPWLGVGTSDVGVRKIWATGERTAIAWLASSRSASPGVFPLTAVAGLATSRLPQTLTLLPSDGRPYVLMGELEGQMLFPGGPALLRIANMPAGTSAANVSAKVGGVSTTVIQVGEGAVTIQVPQSIKPGVYLVELSLAGMQALPAAVEVRPIPPMILYALRVDGTMVTPSTAPRAGDVILLAVGALGEETEIRPEELLVSSGEVQHTVISVRPNPRDPGTHLIEVRLSATVVPESGTIPLTVSRNGTFSIVPYRLPLAP